MTIRTPSRKMRADRMNVEESIRELWVTCHKLAWRIRDLQEEMRTRAHYAAGTDPRSPRYRGDGGFWDTLKREGLREATKRSRSSALRHTGTTKVYYRTKTFRSRWRQNPALAVGYVVFRHPIWWMKMALVALLVFCLAMFTLWHYAIAPFLGPLAHLSIPDPIPGDDQTPENGYANPSPLNPFDLPGGIVPASFCADPASALTPEGGLRGTARAYGDLLGGIEGAEWTAVEIRDAIRATAKGAGYTWTVFRRALDGALEPPAAGTVAPSSYILTAGAGCASSCPGVPVAPVTPSSTGPLTDDQVAALALEVGWPVEEVREGRLGSRVRAESTTPEGPNDPAAQDYVDGTHHGLLQLGPAERDRYLAPGASAFDPRANLEAGLRLWRERGWQPWRASDDAVGQYVPGAQAAAERVLASRPAPNTPVIVSADTGPSASCTVPALHLDGRPATGPESELSASAVVARRAGVAAFPEYASGEETIGGWGTRNGRKTEHDDTDSTGRKASRALDWMVNGSGRNDMALGDRVAAWHIAHWEALHVRYIIWNGRILSDPHGEWEPYDGPSPHTDHVHATYDDAPAGMVTT